MRSLFNKAAVLVAAAVAAGALTTSADAQSFRVDYDDDWRGHHRYGDVRVYRHDRAYRGDRAFRAFARDCVVKRQVRFTPRGRVVKTVRICD